MDAEFARQPSYTRERLASERFRCGTFVGPPAAPVENLGQRHQVCAPRRCQTDQPFRALKVGALVRSRGHLDRCNEVSHQAVPLIAWLLTLYVKPSEGMMRHSKLSLEKSWNQRCHFDRHLNPDPANPISAVHLNTEEPRDPRRPTTHRSRRPN